VHQPEGRCTAEQSLNVVEQGSPECGEGVGDPAPLGGHEALTRLLRHTDRASPGVIIAVQKGEAQPGRQWGNFPDVQEASPSPSPRAATSMVTVSKSVERVLRPRTTLSVPGVPSVIVWCFVRTRESYVCTPETRIIA
jgi:hypothetical protein